MQYPFHRRKFFDKHAKRLVIVNGHYLLGSGLVDKHGQEIFENDTVRVEEKILCRNGQQFSTEASLKLVTFEGGAFYLGDSLLNQFPADRLEISEQRHD